MDQLAHPHPVLRAILVFVVHVVFVEVGSNSLESLVLFLLYLKNLHLFPPYQANQPCDQVPIHQVAQPYQLLPRISHPILIHLYSMVKHVCTVRNVYHFLNTVMMLVREMMMRFLVYANVV